jgi:hypothetical protein
MIYKIMLRMFKEYGKIDNGDFRLLIAASTTCNVVSHGSVEGREAQSWPPYVIILRLPPSNFGTTATRAASKSTATFLKPFAIWTFGRHSKIAIDLM